MKKNWYAILILTVAAWACNDNDYELQSAPGDIFQLWVPISYTPVAYSSDSIPSATEIIYVPFEQSGKEDNCGGLEFFRDGKVNYYDCGFCGTGPLVGVPEEQAWRERNGEIVFRGMPQWITGNYESRIVNATATQLRVIQETR
jgi:hypothetical protein